MPLLYVVGGLVSIGLLVYLVLALLKPELFREGAWRLLIYLLAGLLKLGIVR